MKKNNIYFIAIILAVVGISSGILFSSQFDSTYFPAASATSDSEPPYDLVQIGISGFILDMTVETLSDTDEVTILASAYNGLYVIRQQKIEQFIPTLGLVKHIATIDDINGDSIREAVIAIDDSRFPNVRCYDTTSGEMLWQHSIKQTGFVDGMGWTAIHAAPTALTVMKNNHVIYAAGEEIIMLDGSTGKRIAGYDFNDQSIEISHISPIVDFDGDGTGDVMGAGIWYDSSDYQKLGLRLFSNDFGRLIRSIEVDLVESGHGGRCIMESLDLQTLQDKSVALITAREVEYSPGSAPTESDIIWSVDLSRGDITEQSIDAIMNAGDVDAGGGDDLLYFDVGGTSTTVTLKGGETDTEIWQLAVPDKLGTTHILTIDGEKVALAVKLSGDSTDNEIAFARINIEQGTLLDDLVITAIPLASGARLNSGLDKYLFTYNEDEVIVCLRDSILCVSSEGDTLWDIPILDDSAVIEADITGDDAIDVLLYPQQELVTGNTVARTIAAIDGATHETAWTYNVSYADLINGGDLAHVQLLSDLNGDGKPDIAAVASDGADYKIAEISGADGTLISEVPLAEKIYSLDFVPYATAYSYAVTTETASSVIDRTGTALWSKEFDAGWGSDIGANEHAEIRVLEDLNTDDIPDLITLLPDMIIVSKSNIWPSYIDHDTYDLSGTTGVEYRDTFCDFDEDNVSDIVLSKTEVIDQSPETSTIIVSPLSGEKIYEFEREPYIAPAIADFDGDSHADHLVYQVYQTGDYMMGTQIIRDVYVISGIDGSEITKISTHRGDHGYAISSQYSYQMPACLISDLTGDGLAELAVFGYEWISRPQYSGLSHGLGESYIEIYDVAQDSLLKSIRFDGISLCDSIMQTGDINDNGSNDILANVSGSSFIVDIETGQKITAFCPYRINNVSLDIANVDAIRTVCMSEIYFTDMRGDLAITTPAAASTTSSPVRLAWDSGLANSFTAIYVDGALAAQTNNSFFDLSLTTGEHVVSISVQDEYGKTTYSEITFIVTKGVWPAVYTIILCITFGAALVVPRYLKKIPNIRLKHGGGSRKKS